MRHLEKERSMLTFKDYLDKIGEIGSVEQVVGSIVYASGLPNAKPQELVVFENGDIGQVFSITQKQVEILIFSKNPIKVGTKIARSNSFLEIPVGRQLLGTIINPFGHLVGGKIGGKPVEKRPIENEPSGITSRKTIKKHLETGISVVDLIVPLGKGQRELVIGDRKTGKTNFILQAIVSAAKQNDIAIYAAIGKKRLDIKKAEEYFIRNKVMKNVVIVASASEDPPGTIYLTPYSAMTLAEYFKDEGLDVLLVLDDLSTHAKFYREIALLAGRFPGRNSYPGDIFYTHARLLERAGNFATKNGENAITCLPVVETTQGDLGGYIQTNLMSMTDGHLFFDSNLFYQGRRPAVNPFLSVTRVGRQAQSKLKGSIGRELTSFLNLYEKMQSFVHFGAELNETTKATLATGKDILQFFDQNVNTLLPGNVQILIFSLLWGQMVKNDKLDKIMAEKQKISDLYEKDKTFRKKIDSLVENSQTLNDLLQRIKLNSSYLKLVA